MRRRGLPYLIVLLASAWATRHFWWPSHYVVTFDTGTYAAPNWMVGKSAFTDWRLPLINDRIFGGVPHLGNPQTGTLYPLRWVSYLFEPTRGLNLLAAAHVFLLGTGVTFFSRRLSVSRLGATVSGVVAVLCGAVVTKSIQIEQIMVIAWLPWVLACALMVIRHPERLRYAGALSIAVSMTILSGHPQMTYEVAIVAAMFVLAQLWRNSQWRRALRSISLALAASLLTCSLQLIAALTATGDSYYSGGRDINALGNGDFVLRARHAMQVFLGSVTSDRSDVFAGSFESISYIGVVATLLALLAMAVSVRRHESRRWSIPLVVMAFVGFVWSLGPRTPVFRLAFDFLPGFDLGRVSARWLVVVSMIAAIFVGVGVDLVRQGLTRRMLALVAATTAAGTIAVVALPVRSGSGSTSWIWLGTALLAIVVTVTTVRRPQIRTHLARGLIALLVLEMLLLDRASIVDDVTSDVPAEQLGSATTEWLSSTDGYTIALTDDGGGGPDYLVPSLRPNAAAMFDIASIDGYDGGVQVTRRWANALERISPAPNPELPLRSSVAPPLDPVALARFGVRYVLLDVTDDPSALVPGWRGPMATDDRFAVYENPDWIAPAWAIVTDAPDAPVCEVDCTYRPVDLRVLSPEHLRVGTNLEQSAVVTVPRQALAGWHVTVDGKSAEVTVVDELFLGVRVSAGEHVIEWRYRPAWLAPSVFASLIGVAVTLLLLWGRRPRWRRSTPSAPR